MTIEAALQKATGIKPKKNEDKQKYLLRLQEGVEQLDEKVWDQLSEETQLWHRKMTKKADRKSVV